MAARVLKTFSCQFWFVMLGTFTKDRLVLFYHHFNDIITNTVIIYLQHAKIPNYIYIISTR